MLFTFYMNILETLTLFIIALMNSLNFVIYEQHKSLFENKIDYIKQDNNNKDCSKIKVHLTSVFYFAH